MASKIPHLTARPMLLAHLDDLVRTDRQIKYSFELYEEMVNAWAEREEPWIKKNILLKFSDRLASDLYLNSSSRKATRISRTELARLAEEWMISLDEWKIRTRSLLNRDAEGNYKFAHRSIMEYFLVKRFVDGNESLIDKRWTDQMQIFLWEMIQSSSEKGTLPSVLLGQNWNDSNYVQKEARCQLLACAALVGLQRTIIPPTVGSHQNLWHVIVQLFIPIFSPASCAYPSNQLIRPSSPTAEQWEPSDIRVTLYDVTDFSDEDHKFTVLSTDTRQQLDVAPFWQRDPPIFPHSALETQFLAAKGHPEPHTVYISRLNSRTKYLLGFESSNLIEIEYFFNTYRNLALEIIQSLPDRLEKPNR